MFEKWIYRLYVSWFIDLVVKICLVSMIVKCELFLMDIVEYVKVYCVSYLILYYVFVFFYDNKHSQALWF
jgi:hypothetical protein